jgi:hypothetical protein
MSADSHTSHPNLTMAGQEPAIQASFCTDGVGESQPRGRAALGGRVKPGHGEEGEHGDRRRQAPILFAVLAILSLGVLAGFVRAALIAPLHVPLDPNEGWNAYHATAAMTAGNPYPPANSFMVNNYPPLSFYFVGLFGSWLGDNIVAGRLLSLAAFASLCVFIAIALRRMNAGWTPAAFAALLFASTLLLTSDYVGMDDPQLVGHALQLAGLLFVLHRPRTGANTLAVACLFVAGGFVKHNLFALPLATVAWLAFFDRRNALRLAAGLLLLSLAGFFAVRAILGIDLLHQFNAARTFSLRQMGSNVLDWLPVGVIPLCGLAALLWQCAKDEAALLVSLYAAIAVVSGVFFLGGAGVDVNALFDADIALALCAGLAVARWIAAEKPFAREAAEVFAVFCMIPFAVITLRAPPDWRDPSFWLSPLREETALAKTDIAFLRAHPGSALCEDLTFCYWAGKTPSVDVFNLDQQFETGARDPGSFLRLIRSRYFKSVELDETTPFPFPKNVEKDFLQNYRIDHKNDDGVFFVPR